MSHGSCCCLAKSLASPGSANKNTSAINRGSAVRIIKLLSVDNLLVEYRSLGSSSSTSTSVSSLSRLSIKSGFSIGRASCRERVCQYVSISVVAVSLKTKQTNTKRSTNTSKNTQNE